MAKKQTQYRLKINLTNHNVPDIEIQKALAWYDEAHLLARKLAKNSGFTIAQCAGVISALSPHTKWYANKRDAQNLIYKASGKKALLKQVTPHKPGTYRIGVEKAHKILKAKTTDEIYRIFIGTGKSGFKTLAFFDNILDPLNSDAVTVDMWILRAYGLSKNYTLTERRYTDISNALKRTAKRLKLKPLVCQALIWVIARGKAE